MVDTSDGNSESEFRNTFHKQFLQTKMNTRSRLDSSIRSYFVLTGQFVSHDFMSGGIVIFQRLAPFRHIHWFFFQITDNVRNRSCTVKDCGNFVHCYTVVWCSFAPLVFYLDRNLFTKYTCPLPVTLVVVVTSMVPSGLLMVVCFSSKSPNFIDFCVGWL